MGSLCASFRTVSNTFDRHTHLKNADVLLSILMWCHPRLPTSHLWNLIQLTPYHATHYLEIESHILPVGSDRMYLSSVNYIPLPYSYQQCPCQRLMSWTNCLSNVDYETWVYVNLVGCSNNIQMKYDLSNEYVVVSLYNLSYETTMSL